MLVAVCFFTTMRPAKMILFIGKAQHVSIRKEHGTNKKNKKSKTNKQKKQKKLTGHLHYVKYLRD